MCGFCIFNSLPLFLFLVCSLSFVSLASLNPGITRVAITNLPSWHTTKVNKTEKYREAILESLGHDVIEHDE